MKAPTFARVRLQALMPALLAASSTDGTAEEQAVLSAHVEQSFTPSTYLPAGVTEVETSLVRSYKEPASEWTKSMAKRFRELARKEALGTISEAELAELEQLARDRRLLQHPRTVEEVLWETKQQAVTAKLVQALREYVEFHQATRSARAAAR